MRYEVWCPGLGCCPDEAGVFDTVDAAAAAEAWAAWEDGHSADFWIVGGTDAQVRVRQVDSDRIHDFVVSGELVRRYRARPARIRSST